MSGAGEVRGAILVLAPVDGDAEAVRHVLRRGGFGVRVCTDVAEFTGSLVRDAGAIVIAEEALAAAGSAGIFGEALAGQPDWSDLPVVLLARQGASEDSAWSLARELESVGNITILERPLRRSTLLNAVGVALRARARQHELRAHKEHLEWLVEERTAALTESLGKLQAQERLAALGTLAAGLGHDISNLVLPIRMRLESLSKERTTPDAVEDIAAIGTALGYLTNLSAGLRLMALDPQREGASMGVDDLSWWWSQAHGVFRGALPRGVRLTGELPPGVGVRMSSHRLTQAVFNLVQNAGEALAEAPEGGEVRVVAEGPGSGGRMVRLRVRDNGPGMTPEVVARCFEPYFSTKSRAIATGMGLAMVRGLAESAGGAVEVQSAAGRGAVFTLVLPVVERQGGLARASAARRTRGTAALSVREKRTGAIAAMLLEGLELKVVVPSGAAPSEGDLWIAQDPPAIWVEDYLQQRPGRRVIVLESAREAGAHGWAGRDEVTVLPLSTPPSRLREALLTAARGAASAEGGRR